MKNLHLISSRSTFPPISPYFIFIFIFVASISTIAQSTISQIFRNFEIQYITGRCSCFAASSIVVKSLDDMSLCGNERSSSGQTMDQKAHEVEQTANILPVANKSCSELLTPIKKSHVQDFSDVDANFVSATPMKTEATVNSRCKKEPDELPEKYRLLSEIFYRMTTSLRLLNLGKKLPTFQNICHVVETLSERKFTYKSLAQIKFILPEAVQIDRILVHNKKTLCMEPDMKVTLLFDIVEGHVEHTDYLALSRLISSRLFKFANAHPEDEDVPTAELPEPFNRKEITVSAKLLSMNSSVRIQPDLDETEPVIASHLSPSFRRHFSREIGKPMKTELTQSPVLLSSVKEIEKPMKTELSQSPIMLSSIKEMEKPMKTELQLPQSPCLELVKQEKALQVANRNTPMQKPLVTNDIIVETPDLSAPKRSVVGTVDDKPKSMVNQKAMASSLFAKRSLDFSDFDEESVFVEGNTTSNSSSSEKVHFNFCFCFMNQS
ncbi:hypothetical protein QVD17_07627 [Tagetes erecta]|uniref:CDT1 Geminin-binding domain-containing protein n=1 Tax=Tagetes erecta TaxID=13708 RepID=A0AAD8PC42_TARER|nr:hypothetical protein QVD17_07627 [Tagetes erecta]